MALDPVLSYLDLKGVLIHEPTVNNYAPKRAA